MQKEFRTMHLFAGAGGGILGDLILGHTPIVAVEWEPYPCQILRERVTDGWFPGMHVYEGDVRLFDSSEYKGKVDCVHAGFPCQDISNAGNQAGVADGTRSGLYRQVLRIADELREDGKKFYISLENVSAIVTGNDGAMLRTVTADLAERGFDVVWYNLSAAEIGARHNRNRWWLLAWRTTKVLPNPNSIRCVHRESQEQSAQAWKHAQCDTSTSGENVSDSKALRVQRCGADRGEESRPHAGKEVPLCGGSGSGGNVRSIKPNMGGMADDVAHQLDANDWVREEAQVGRTTTEKENRANRLKVLGNGQVPLQAAAAFSILWAMMEATQ